MNLDIQTKLVGPLIVQDIGTTFDGVRETMHRQVADTSDAQVIAALVKLGWTPPGQQPQVVKPDSPDFVVRTNADYIAWCATFYHRDALDANGMQSLHGLWAWQEQERRKESAESTLRPSLHVGNSAFEHWFQGQRFATQPGTGVKQISRNSYAAGMSDPAVLAKAEIEPVLAGLFDSLQWHTTRHGNYGLDASRLYDAKAILSRIKESGNAV